MFISYIYSPYLSKDKYDGFLYQRGCKSWWDHLLWSPILKTYTSLIEVDFSSGFPNLSLHCIKNKKTKKALESDQLLPPNLINLIITHLQTYSTKAVSFPTLETYIENHENLVWKKSCRSVPMGIGISPILFVISLNWALNQIDLLKSNAQMKWYADDGSIFLKPPNEYEPGYHERK